MPHLGSQRIDDLGVRLMERWIRSLPEEQESNRAGVHAAKRVRMQQQRLLEELHNRDQSRSHEPSPQGIDRLLETTGGALMLMKEIRDGRSSESLSRAIVERAAGRSDSSIRDLFERFLPPQRRARLLGENVDPASILGLTGNSKRGERLFFDNASLRCQSCHRIGNRGTQVGPDLDGIAKRYNRAKILESILNPSRMIDPAFTSHIVETVDGRILTGILVEKNGNQVVLKDLMGKTVRVPREDIEQMRPTRKSLMPELLLRDLTAQEAADLVAFLEELKKE